MKPLATFAGGVLISSMLVACVSAQERIEVNAQFTLSHNGRQILFGPGEKYEVITELSDLFLLARVGDEEIPIPKAYTQPARPAKPITALPNGPGPLKLDLDVEETGSGLFVRRVFQGGIGHRLGFQPGDTIVQVNDQRILEMAQFAQVAAKGGRIKFNVVNPTRADRLINYPGDVKPIRHEVHRPVQPPAPPRSLGIFGREDMQLGGFAVTVVKPNSIAQRSGLRRGDVILTINGFRIRDESMFKHAEKNVFIKGKLHLEFVQRNGEFVEVNLP